MPNALPEPFGPAEFQAVSNVSRETLARLKLFVSLLEDWNARMNLVSAKSLADVWRRHIWDSAQLFPLLPSDAKSLVDLGSGAGFPGLVLAILLGENAHVVLYEVHRQEMPLSRRSGHRTGAPVEVRNGRIEEAKPRAIRRRHSTRLCTAGSIAFLCNAFSG